MKAQSRVWLGIANDDLETAEHCFLGNQYLWTLFMCQQAIEKTLKAIFFETTNKTPPKKHDLISLAGAGGILNVCDENTQDLFRHLSLYYIETRYPDKRAEIERECTEEFTEDILNRSKGAQLWLKSMLK